MTRTATRKTVVTKCGDELYACCCSSPVMRTPEEVESAHQEAVRRARSRGWARGPVPRWVLEALLPYAWRDERVA